MDNLKLSSIKDKRSFKTLKISVVTPRKALSVREKMCEIKDDKNNDPVLDDLVKDIEIELVDNGYVNVRLESENMEMSNYKVYLNYEPVHVPSWNKILDFLTDEKYEVTQTGIEIRMVFQTTSEGTNLDLPKLPCYYKDITVTIPADTCRTQLC